jgi:hypothetical protein
VKELLGVALSDRDEDGDNVSDSDSCEEKDGVGGGVAVLDKDSLRDDDSLPDIELVAVSEGDSVPRVFVCVAEKVTEDDSVLEVERDADCVGVVDRL